MKVLILAEHKNGTLKSFTKELLTAAAGQEVEAIVFGEGAQQAGEELGALGVSKTYAVTNGEFKHYHPVAYEEACVAAFEKAQPRWVLASASSLGKDLLPRLAARLEKPLVADVIDIDLAGATLKKPFFAGKAIASMKASGDCFVSIRPNALAAGKVSDSVGEVEELDISFDFAGSTVKFLEKTATESDRPDLVEARVVVSGGRSLKSKENFKIIFDCADSFGGAAGASRAACDEGLADHSMQVGQTGKTVNPDLYIACGISGAIQHLAGMRTSKVIVAINKDPNAPIFKKADYGIVGDLFEVLPALTQEVKKVIGQAA